MVSAEISHQRQNTQALTSENDFKKLARLLFGDGVNAFCRRT